MEILDLVSANDQVIGTISRDAAYANSLTHFRTVNGFVVNSNRELWIPTRHTSKALWPDLLDASVGGHVQSGETYEDAFKRETREELNLDLTTIPFIELGKLSPHEVGVGSFMKIFLIFYDKDIQYNPSDFSDGNYISYSSLIKKLTPITIGKPDLVPILKWMEELFTTPGKLAQLIY